MEIEHSLFIHVHKQVPHSSLLLTAFLKLVVAEVTTILRWSQFMPLLPK